VLKEALQRGLLRKPNHFHGPLDGCAVFLETEAIGCGDNGHNTEIDLGSKAPIQTHFLLAEVLAFLERSEIEEARLDRFLDLVDERTSQKNDGDVSLHYFDRFDRVGVGGGGGELLDQVLQIHGSSPTAGEIRKSGSVGGG
jgi:hypothetical protein